MALSTARPAGTKNLTKKALVRHASVVCVERTQSVSAARTVRTIAPGAKHATRRAAGTVSSRCAVLA